MFKKPGQIKPLPSGLADAFSRTLARQGFVAPVQQPAPAPKQLAEGSVNEAVKEVPPSELAKSPNTVKGSVAHKLGVGVDMKQMMQHAKSSRDIDMDGDVDELDKTTPDEITGAEKENQTPKMMKKYEKEKKHTKVGVAFEAVESGSCKCDDPEYNSKGMCKECGKPEEMHEALDPVDPKTVHKPLLARKDKDIDNNGKVDDSDKYIHKRRQAIARSLAIHEDALHPDAHKVLKHIKPEHQAKYKPDLTKKHYTGNYADRSAVIKAAQSAGHLKEDSLQEDSLHPDAHKVLKHIKPEHHAKYTPDLTKKHYTGNYADRAAVIKAAQSAGHLKEDTELEEGWDDMLKAAKERAKPQPNGGAGNKQGTAYGGSKQKDAPSPKKEAVEALDELSKSTIDKYIPAAAKSRNDSFELDYSAGQIHKAIRTGKAKTNTVSSHPGNSSTFKNPLHKDAGVQSALQKASDAMDTYRKPLQQTVAKRNAGLSSALARKSGAKPTSEQVEESVKVGDKVSFDHPMTAAPGKTMKKVGTVKKIEGDTAHLKSSTKYGTLSYQKKVSELRKEEVEELDELSKKTLHSYIGKRAGQVITAAGEANRGKKFSDKEKTKLIKQGNAVDRAVEKHNEEFELGEGIFDSLKKGYTNGLKQGLKQKIKPEHHKSYGIDDVKSTSDATSILQKAKQAGHTHVKEEVEEELKGNQHKLDKNKNGKLDKHDFKLLNKESVLDEGKYGDDDWVIMQKGGTMDNPKKDTIIGYRKAGKGAYSAPKTEPGQKAMRISLAKQKGYAISEEVAELAEAPSYKLYHTTFSAAVQEAIAVAKKQGFEVDEEDWQSKVATGPKKPSKDKTNSYSIDLTKNGSPTKKKLQIQVYNMGEKYELNTYVQ